MNNHHHTYINIGKGVAVLLALLGISAITGLSLLHSPSYKEGDLHGSIVQEQALHGAATEFDEAIDSDAKRPYQEILSKGKRLIFEGEVAAFIDEEFPDGEAAQPKGTVRYFLQAEGSSLRRIVLPGRLPAHLPIGSRIRFAAMEWDGELVPLLKENGSIQDMTVQSAARPALQGPHKTAVLLVKFQDQPMPSLTQEQARANVFTGPLSANAYHTENSYGTLSLVGKTRPDGDVFGWLTIPFKSDGRCKTRPWAEAAKKAAVDSGIDIQGYDNFIYVFPNAPCGFNGKGGIGKGETWINMRGKPNLRSEVVAHELGHNFGTWHANSLVCTSSTGARVPLSQTCTSNEYGDPFDIMGNVTNFRHASAYHKAQVSSGFQTSTTVRTVTEDGYYKLWPLEVRPSNVTMLRVPRPGQPEDLYVDFRQPKGVFDAYDSSDPAIHGVMLRLAADYRTWPPAQNGTRLIDMHPQTPGFKDAPLTYGETFLDPSTGVRIQLYWVSFKDKHAIVYVDFPGR